MSKNRYIFNTELTGFIKIDEPGGKYNNCTFAITIPTDVLADVENDREELIEWAKTKLGNPKRLEIKLPQWDEDGLVKYSYLGETNRPAVVFVDTEGSPLSKEVLASIRKGTKVRVIAQQSPYTKPVVGTKFRILGCQVLELVTGNGAVDSGSLTEEDVVAMFQAAAIDGYKASEPQVRKAETPEPTSGYDF